ncbi:hypothetical protein BMF94_0660 [Rhodotorula taiwanensis]|uniref:Uncharacterized protein n=1 Tax=Rhodotorula taiwanensis TaxID=741276 RepID=A0A2S5BI53_9BASI|nr:hypothetical protein BMF94_0660 [Rhodotorula taiwanensis]
MSRPRPSANQQRLTRVIVTLPFVVVSSWILYKRLVLGEQQRTMPRPGQPGADQHVLATSLSQEARRKNGEAAFGADRREGMPDDLARRVREAEQKARP